MQPTEQQVEKPIGSLEDDEPVLKLVSQVENILGTDIVETKKTMDLDNDKPYLDLEKTLEVDNAI